MSDAALTVSTSHASRLTELAERLDRPAQELLGEALDRYLDEHAPSDAPAPGFDEVVFGEGEDSLKFGADEFRALPLRRQVHLLLSKAPHFYRGGEEIPREQAMSLGGR
jgi:hypothetical protein